MIILKLLKWFILIVLGLLIVVIGIFAVGSYTSMDRNYLHTKHAESLPMYSSELFTTEEMGLARVSANGFEFRTRIANNNPAAPTVILLHGFPVTSAMWDPIIPDLANAGYRVIAFDQRGYSPGARPADESAYATANLISDVMAVADAVGVDKFHLIGHDWGAAVGWGTVMQHSERILTWTGLSIAHPVAFGEALQTDPDQQARSSYFALFTAPWLPETLFTFNDLMILMGMYSESNMRPEQQQEYRAAFSEPGALTAGLNWYRQMGAGPASGADISPEISIPVLFIWGDNDPSAGRVAVEAQEKYMKGPYRKIELKSGHWLITSHAKEIGEAVLTHLAEHSVTDVIQEIEENVPMPEAELSELPASSPAEIPSLDADESTGGNSI